MYEYTRRAIEPPAPSPPLPCPLPRPTSSRASAMVLAAVVVATLVLTKCQSFTIEFMWWARRGQASWTRTGLFSRSEHIWCRVSGL